MLEPAFAIVGQNHQIGILQSGLEVGKLGHQHFVTRLVFEVDAQQLLLAADDTQLDCRGQRRIAVQLRIDSLGLQQFLNASGRLVLADDRQQTGVGSDRGDVARHVGGTTQTLLGSPHSDHRYGRLG